MADWTFEPDIAAAFSRRAFLGRSLKWASLALLCPTSMRQAVHDRRRRAGHLPDPHQSLRKTAAPGLRRLCRPRSTTAALRRSPQTSSMGWNSRCRFCLRRGRCPGPRRSGSAPTVSCSKREAEALCFCPRSPWSRVEAGSKCSINCDQRRVCPPALGKRARS